MTISRSAYVTAAARRLGDGVLIAGTLAATATALIAAVVLFAMAGRLSHRRAAAVPPGLTAGAGGGERS